MVDGAGVGPRAGRIIRRAKAKAACGRPRKGTIMLWTIFLVLAIMWLLGFSLNVGGGLIHLLLLVALVVLLFNFLGGRRVTG
jgi:Family of unknown function (DUF5670)